MTGATAIRRLGVLTVLLSLGLAACSTPPEPTPAPIETPAADSAGPDAPFIDADTMGVNVAPGDDWTLPANARPATNSGFFSEEAAPDSRVFARSIDLSWRQIQPQPGDLDRTSTGAAQGLEFESLDDQLADPSPYWVRLFASGETWAPEWVTDDCGVDSYGPDYDDERHLPIWNECVWGHLLDTYRALLVDSGMLDDPRLRLVFVPGAFTWAEFDYDIVNDAVEAGELTESEYLDWYSHAWSDLADLAGDRAGLLVFTGEDYPFGPFGAADDLLARDAVDAGLGIRNGITELSNFHLSEAPAYGSSITDDGHLVVDESLPIHDGTRIVAAENECYTDCGYDTDDPYYAVRQSNLKALQLRVNWLYVVPEPSFMAEYPEQWDWVRLSIGQTAETSPDAWAALRDASDEFWRDAPPPALASDAWPTRPFVRNLERWIVQVDRTGSVAHRSDADVHEAPIEPDNGTAYEGLSTDVAGGDTGFVFTVDPRWAAAAGDESLVVKVTYLDEGEGAFHIDTAVGPSASVERSGSGGWMTATIALPAGALGSDPDAAEFRLSLADGASDLDVRFVRVIRLAD